MNENIEFNVKKFQNFNMLEFIIKSGIIEPKDIKNISIPEISFNKGIIISGRGPIWLYCFLAHLLHPAKWVAVHDPRLGGGVVVESHTKEASIGDLIKIE